MTGATWCAGASALGAIGLAAALWIVALEDEFGSVTLGFLGMVGACVLLLGWAGLAARRDRRGLALPAAWIGAVLLLGLAIISGFSIGGLFLPGTVVGLIAAGKLTAER